MMTQRARRATPPGAHGDAMRGSGTPGECARIPDATCGRLDDGAELWGPAALARAQTRDATTPLSEETGLMRELRKKSGPFASDATLRAHLRAARGKLHWSMNGYFRQAVLDADPRAKCDFEPRPLASDRPADESSSGADNYCEPTCRDDGTDVPRLPPLVWELVLARVPAVDACRLARVSSSTRDAAHAPPVWRRQFVSRWGDAAASRVASRAAPDTPDWRDEYRRRHARERAMTCPECLAARVTPIVYGFPSPALVSALRRGRVLLGGDYLVDGDPAWGCRACQSRWLRWPFAWPDVGPEQIERGISPWPGLSGARGGARGTGADLDDATPLPRWRADETNVGPDAAPRETSGFASATTR